MVDEPAIAEAFERSPVDADLQPSTSTGSIEPQVEHEALQHLRAAVEPPGSRAEARRHGATR
jgi:hypothetical protein